MRYPNGPPDGFAGAGGRMPDWVAVESGRPTAVRKFFPRDENLNSDANWTGFRLAQGNSQPGQLPEGYLRLHLVSLNLGEPAIHELYVVGQPRRTETVTRESIFVFPARVPFTAQWQSPLTTLDFLVEPEFMSNVVRPEMAAHRLELRPTYSSGDPFIAQALYALRRDLQEGFPRGRLYGETLGTALVVHLLRDYAQLDSLGRAPKGWLPPNRLRRVVDYINDRLEADLSLAELSALVGLNPDYFARAFRQTTGLSPYRYVLLKRIDRACGLLSDPRIPIGEIAERSGFGSNGAFTTAFRRVRGVTPSAYRYAVL
jgi:AraC family transcriptional regulator